MMSLGPIGFLQPWLLAGLMLLPMLWILLRMIPPQPERLWFPALRFLFGLKSSEKSSHHMPWWLLLLRMVLLAAVIIALARPVYNPQNDSFSGADQTSLVVLVDNGWASAKDWGVRVQSLQALLSEAEQKQQRVLLMGTAHSGEDIKRDTDQVFLPAVLARQRMVGLKPHPFNPDRLKILEDLKGLIRQEAQKSSIVPHVIWISDGLDYGSSRRFAEGLIEVAGGAGRLKIIASRPDQTYGVFASHQKSGELKARVVRSGGGPARGLVLALSGRGDRLAEAKFKFADRATYTDAVFTLPLELRNQVSRFEIDGQATAGAVHLLDGRGNRLRVGIFSGESSSDAQPLLSAVYYIERALDPYADLITTDNKKIGQSLEGVLSQKTAMLVLADIGQITGRTEKTMQKWIEAGGMLVRFAGPRLEERGDSLLPVSLRTGGRALGGALSWSTPQNLSPFEKKSPFYGLEISQEINVTRQVLADPVRNFENSQVWARLTDGTPLVSAQKRGKGWSVLFHVTANSEWSNLPLSGLFVEMFQRLITLSQSTNAMTAGGVELEKNRQPGQTLQEVPESQQEGSAEIKALTENLLLNPFQVLDGYGQLVSPEPSVKALNPGQLETISLGYTTPPGFYGPAEGGRALNVIGPKSSLIPITSLPEGVELSVFSKAQTVLLKPWFLMCAFLLFILDAAISFLLAGTLISYRERRAAGHAASLFYGVFLCSSVWIMMTGAGFAQDAPKDPAQKTDSEKIQSQNAQKQAKEQEAFNIQAAIGTRLAYVLTGDAEVDRISKYAMSGLSKVLAARTAFEPDEPMGVDVIKDELVFFPMLYWPVPPNAQSLPDHALAKIDTYMKNGGMIIFDTRDYQSNTSGQGSGGPGSEALQKILGRLNIPRLEEVPDAHVLKKSFYLLKTFPGRWEGGTLWVEADSQQQGAEGKRGRRSDGVSSILITSNDFAGAWALDEMNSPLLPVVPGGEMQREMAFRAGVNIIMYALTGNYKADQVHVPALLERLGQ